MMLLLCACGVIDVCSLAVFVSVLVFVIGSCVIVFCFCTLHTSVVLLHAVCCGVVVFCVIIDGIVIAGYRGV